MEPTSNKIILYYTNTNSININIINININCWWHRNIWVLTCSYESWSGLGAPLSHKASLCINTSAPPVPSSPQGAILVNCRKQMKKRGSEREGELRWSLWGNTAFYLFTFSKPCLVFYCHFLCFFLARRSRSRDADQECTCMFGCLCLWICVRASSSLCALNTHWGWACLCECVCVCVFRPSGVVLSISVPF